MSRERKFRAWNKRLGDFVYFGLFYYRYMQDDKSFVIDVLENHSDTITEYTGLKDKNGKEIWEGDILVEAESPKSRGTIVYDAPSFKINWGNDLKSILISELSELLVVVGNIYEHPDLVKDL